jgi:hypothetical protein
VIIMKSELAQELGVTRSAVSRYCERGLPVRGDGRLDREVALRWVERNVTPTYHHGKGAAVARERRERPMPACLRPFGGRLTTSDHDVHEAMASTLLAMVQNTPRQIAAVAAGTGAPMKVVFALFHGAALGLAQYANNEMERCGITWSRPDALDPVPLFPPVEPDWAALAKMAGEEVDFAAWEEHAQNVLTGGEDKSADSRKPRRSRKSVPA